MGLLETDGEKMGGWAKLGLRKGLEGSTGVCEAEGREEKRQRMERMTVMSGAVQSEGTEGWPRNLTLGRARIHQSHRTVDEAKS